MHPSSSTYDQVVEHVRRVRARRRSGAAQQALSRARRSPWRRGVALWSAAATLWTVCWAAPLYTGLHVRAALARPRSIVASDVPRRDPVTALLRTWLLHGLSLTPEAHVPASRGTAEVAAWSPNGQYLAVGYSSGGLLIWDVVHRHLGY